MTEEIKSWTESTTDDFLKVVKSRFPVSALRTVQRMLDNPLRSTCPECGDIAYENGVPKVVQGAILRKLYLGQNPILGVVGGMLGAEKDASPISIINVMKRTIAPRGGSQIYFANTACPTSLKMNQLLKVTGVGPASCAQSRFAIIRCWDFFLYLFRRKILKMPIPIWEEALPHPEPWLLRRGRGLRLERQLRIDKQLFDMFWSRYLKKNRGLVCSRSGVELEWMFADRVRSGRVVMLTLSDSEGVLGYVALGAGDALARRWSILDLVAIRNDPDLIRQLLKGVRCFLRQKTRAVTVAVIGFPASAQNVIARALPFRRALPCNYSLWKVTDAKLCKMLSDLEASGEHWFFGPYDGDMCME